MMKPGREYPSKTAQIRSSCGNVYVTTVHPMDNSNKMICVLMSSGKAGGCAAAHFSYHSTRISDVLKKSPQDRIQIFAEMTSIHCHQPYCCINLVGHYLLDLAIKEE